MRSKNDSQGILRFQRARLALTEEYHARYEEIDCLLRASRGILDLVHRDLKRSLESANKTRSRQCEYTSDHVLRILIVKTIEADTFRGVTVRVDDSDFLRWFTRIHGKDMMHFTLLNRLGNCIRPETWKKINDSLGQQAVKAELIEGEKLRLDTTAVETNIHYPTDSSLLWDVYRVLSRLLERARELFPKEVGNRRLQRRRVKKLYTSISRKASAKGMSSKKLKAPYSKLMGHVEAILDWTDDAVTGLEKRRKSRPGVAISIDSVLSELQHFAGLGASVVDQARRRVLDGEQVPNHEKIFSIFEDHTELLKRGKAAKPIEFGHMILLQQVGGKFISDYQVFENKPVEHQIVDPALRSHEKLFGHLPTVLTADKGFYQSMAKIAELEERIEVVSIAKKGGRSEEEAERESDVLFKIAQKFRAGIEGTISFLKRCFRLFRCFNKGFVHYSATVGLTVFAHNLLVLVRDTS